VEGRTFFCGAPQEIVTNVAATTQRKTSESRSERQRTPDHPGPRRRTYVSADSLPAASAYVEMRGALERPADRCTSRHAARAGLRRHGTADGGVARPRDARDGPRAVRHPTQGRQLPTGQLDPQVMVSALARGGYEIRRRRRKPKRPMRRRKPSRMRRPHPLGCVPLTR